MPYHRPGCQTCRTRRIKCDQTHPVCQRCQKSHRTCAGLYRAQSQPFHHENRYASGQQKRPRGPRRRPASPSPSLSPRLTPLLILRQPQPSLKTQAIAHYLHHYTSPSPSTNPSSFTTSLTETYISTLRTLPQPHFHHSPPVITTADLEKAITPLALAYFARAKHYPPAAREASSTYALLLRDFSVLLRSVETDPSPRQIDTLLLMIFFMSRYEDTVHPVPGHSTTTPGWMGSSNGFAPPTASGGITRGSTLAKDIHATVGSFAHQDGALAVLRVWVLFLARGDRGTWKATEAIKLTRRAMMRSALMRGRALPVWILDGRAFGEREGVEARLDGLAVRVVQLRGEVVALGTRNFAQTVGGSREGFLVGNMGVAKEVYSQARMVRAALEAWKVEVDWVRRWSKEVVEGTVDVLGSGNAKLLADRVLCFSDLAHAVLWCHFLTLRMLVESVCLRVLLFVESEIPGSGAAMWCDLAAARELAAAHEAELKNLARQLAACLPFVLGQIEVKDNAAWGIRSVAWNEKQQPTPYRASLVVWPLTVASGIEGLGDEQRWFKTQLGHLGRVTGVGVLECAEGDEWLKF
ncbi:Zn(II)2Cys6 transcription factor domain-containing protein [Aspergillus homomorphus CBS 101889]|uniref:Zn(2)-C6 fungal-type domain-containing protein n=1 Tax=Aspergillus homomorphus (strain CBS 101889) TaxID=1450537 RepID=A0A395I3E6_ASPHC|nr:hypothetical protein BO97DRAFT_476874 [Aspergillus homomorphus CBS 101889]RAL14133.1 hypothetical protein BO97DRAFT_476874 [Aspergillus homomorphus CBS 101889]